ncbi:hypothetical protein N7468_006504 [Penicillium chermesinum]|uniref:Uncharacterized protein n=1 Tax=Penicillium chermesinum TaxID=63820 RepID=A0A9W9NV63_9EURO|nr:uncharacterized protein N7468_006504 [Penicillium chermesinum]KAJ5225279.1 hypothetical protein N7468_006504 [Penicillium chermesinum]
MASRAAAALFLLPPPPSFSLAEVKVSFEQPLSDVLSRLGQSVRGTDKIAILDIALAVPTLHSASNKPQAKIFPPLQHYLASFYTLIGAIATARDIELDSPGGLDIRVVFLDQPTSSQDVSYTGSHFETGPIVSLQTIASSGRQWDQIFYLGNTAGQELRPLFWEASRKRPEVQQYRKPPPYLVPGIEPIGPNSPDRERILTIGVTGDELLKKKKYAECLESWEQRYQSTAAFLSAIMDFTGNKNLEVERTRTADGRGQVVLLQVQPYLRFKFEEFFDVCGPTATDEEITALVLSKETQAGGAFVNSERAKKGWHTLAVFEVDVLHSGRGHGYQ